MFSENNPNAHGLMGYFFFNLCLKRKETLHQFSLTDVWGLRCLVHLFELLSQCFLTHKVC